MDTVYHAYVYEQVGLSGFPTKNVEHSLKTFPAESRNPSWQMYV